MELAGNTKSNSKLAKKARKYYRKEMRNEARKWCEIIGNAMKPKPAWIPWKIWLLGAGIFIKIKK